MKTGSLFKLAIVCFIIYAICNGNSATIKRWASKVSHGIAEFKSASTQKKSKNEDGDVVSFAQRPTTPTTAQVTQQASGSMFSNITATVINQILDNPNGRKMFEAALAKSLQQNSSVVNELKASPHQTLVKDITLETGQDINCTCRLHKQ